LGSGKMEKYFLKCSACGADYNADLRYSCEKHREDALLKTVYSRKKLKLKKLRGISKFIEWLPVAGLGGYEKGPAVYKSRELAGELGLKNLYISFSGFWEEKNASAETCTFKEFEAVVALEYAREKGFKEVIAPSAGNTARALAAASNFIPVNTVSLVPKENLKEVKIPAKAAAKNFSLIGVSGDYFRAIELSKGFGYETGAKNYAVRDALATIVYEAALKIKKLPSHYFQAVSSGSGAIAAYEASERLVNDGRFGKEMPKIHVSQCAEFSPIVRAWNKRKQKIEAEEVPRKICAKVLSHRAPAYGIKGGLYYALKKTKSFAYGIKSREAKDAARIFEKREGIDIVPAAAVCAASLFNAAEKGQVNKKDVILLNITGGGEKRIRMKQIKPIAIVSTREELGEVLNALRGKSC